MIKGPLPRHLVAGLMAVLAGPALAAPTPTTPTSGSLETVAVAYGDIDFNRADATAILDARIAAAVDRLCGPIVTDKLDELVENRECRLGAIASAAPNRRVLLARIPQRTASR